MCHSDEGKAEEQFHEGRERCCHRGRNSYYIWSSKVLSLIESCLIIAIPRGVSYQSPAGDHHHE
jgi:hypothetical protein